MHTNPDDMFGDLIVANAKLTSTDSEVTQTIADLRPDTDYRVEVSVHNGVSDKDPDNAHKRICSISTTTEGERT